MSKAVYISVIIPTYQRNDLLSQCLDCLKPEVQRLDPANYEVIVTDDGKDEKNASEMILQKYPWVTWTQGPKRGPAANRNHGASLALGEWLAFVDDDCLPDCNWLKAIHAVATSNQALEIIEGQTVTPDKEDDPFKLGVENLSGGQYWSCNIAIRRTLFCKLGGFDEDFLEAGGEDMELAFRIEANKLQVVFVREALVLHPTRIVTWKMLIWRTFLIRWKLLYDIKTGQSSNLSCPYILAVAELVVKNVLDLLRTTWQLVSKYDRTMWRTRLFYQLWKWLTFPIVLPYLILWEVRFRKQLKNKK